jgi:hypothetical protein
LGAHPFAAQLDAASPRPYQLSPTDAAAAAADAQALIESDLVCTHCEYNLRGLRGDPVRCPECGVWNERGILLIPAEHVRWAVRSVEWGPRWMVVLSVLAVLLLLGCIAGGAGMVLASFVLVGGLWGVTCIETVSGIRSPASRRSILLRFHVATLVIVAAPVSCVLLRAIWPSISDRIRMLSLLVAMPLSIVGCAMGMWLYSRAKPRFLTLKRDEIVRVAHQRLRDSQIRRG